jgi:hypothetical protein
MVVQKPQKLDRRRRLKPIAVLDTGVAMESGLVILNVKAADAGRLDITLDNRGTANNAQHDVGGDIVAE